jgi:hypothetical protein
MADDYIKMALVEEMKRLAGIFYAQDQLRTQEYDLTRQAFRQIMKIHSLIDLSDDLPSTARAVRLVKSFYRLGLTQTVRTILEGTGDWMSASQVRDYLVRLRFDLTKYKTPLGSINTILTRLVEAGDVESDVDKKSGKTLYHVKEPHHWTEEEIEQYPEAMLEPAKRRRKRRSSRRKGKDEPLMITEGSLKVN